MICKQQIEFKRSQLVACKYWSNKPSTSTRNGDAYLEAEMKIKLFGGRFSDLGTAEADVNRWCEENEGKITIVKSETRIEGRPIGPVVLVTIWYDGDAKVTVPDDSKDPGCPVKLLDNKGTDDVQVTVVDKDSSGE